MALSHSMESYGQSNAVMYFAFFSILNIVNPCKGGCCKKKKIKHWTTAFWHKSLYHNLTKQWLKSNLRVLIPCNVSELTDVILSGGKIKTSSAI